MQVFNVNFYYKLHCSVDIVHNDMHRTTCELNKVGYSVAFTHSICTDYMFAIK